ncbi:hypothetical protein BDV93DRAFT_558669 [Ceratobasidium sp. AG-I]|nr:hypothetical protein BDV93DRAFT_558669 [Ceratobasidium sp. AG-I]
MGGLLNGITDLICHVEALEETQSEHDVLSSRLRQILLVVQKDFLSSTPEEKSAVIEELNGIQHLLDHDSGTSTLSRIFHANNKLQQYARLSWHIDHLVEMLQETKVIYAPLALRSALLTIMLLRYHAVQSWLSDLQSQIQTLSKLMLETESRIPELHNRVTVSISGFHKTVTKNSFLTHMSLTGPSYLG